MSKVPYWKNKEMRKYFIKLIDESLNTLEIARDLMEETSKKSYLESLTHICNIKNDLLGYLLDYGYSSNAF